MASTRMYVFIFCTLLPLSLLYANAAVSRPPRTIGFLDIFGLGSRCGECPPHFCEEDPAIVHGYCCGCARSNVILPIHCGPAIDCPYNGYDLCDDFEYMMNCCC